MLRKEKFNALIESLMQSLKNCQYENHGMSFDKDAQFAFGSNWYGTMTEFGAEFEEWLYNADSHRVSEYVKDVYYEIAYFGILFQCLKDDYERRLAGNGMSQLSVETYGLVDTYQSAIESEVDRMRKKTAKYVKVALTPYEKLTIGSFTIDWKYIDKSALTPDQHSNSTLGPKANNEKSSSKQKEYDPPLILADKQGQIFKTLSPDVDTDQHDNFKKVLNGEKIDVRIWVKLKNIVLIDVFLRVLGKNKTPHVELAYWLSIHFNYGKQVEKPVSCSSAYDILLGKESLDRSKQLVLK